jgi:hypothetical protein
MPHKRPDSLAASQQRLMALSRWENEGGAGPLRQEESSISAEVQFEGHCQSKFYTACSRARPGWSCTVFAHESWTRSAGFDAENGLYLFALTVPTNLSLQCPTARPPAVRIGSASPSNPRRRSVGRTTSAQRTYGLTNVEPLHTTTRLLSTAAPTRAAPGSSPNAASSRSEKPASISAQRRRVSA